MLTPSPVIVVVYYRCCCYQLQFTSHHIASRIRILRLISTICFAPHRTMSFYATQLLERRKRKRKIFAVNRIHLNFVFSLFHQQLLGNRFCECRTTFATKYVLRMADDRMKIRKVKTKKIQKHLLFTRLSTERRQSADDMKCF